MIKFTNLIVRTGIRSFAGVLSPNRGFCAAKDGGNYYNQSINQ